MTARNQLILMSDEHARSVTGCYGNPIVQTPHLDALASRGTRFANAYTPSPICVPARAAIATGLPIHLTGHWDNAHPYEGTPKSWAHILRDAGRDVVSIGKLHYRDAQMDTGFTEQILPMHVEDGRGDIAGSIRAPLPVRHQSRRLADNLGPGESSYTRYDRAVRDAASNWLQQAGATGKEGWTLLVSFVAPHFPLVAPQAFYDLYGDVDLAPNRPAPDETADHPWLKALRGSYVYDNFTDAKRREALRNYYGLVSFLDDNIGEVLGALDTSGAASSTDIIYLSDHGDNLGERGMWGKSTFFEESAGVPLIYAPIKRGEMHEICQTPVSLTDLYPTALGVLAKSEGGFGRSGRQLADLALSASDPDRPILAQYHAAGSPSGAFMVRRGRFKYCYYVGYEPQLFDLEADPNERQDLAASGKHDAKLFDLHTDLCRLLGQRPESVDARAKVDQGNLISRYGGPAKVLSGPTLTATSTPIDGAS
ncbi:MAG: sulfatase-like hydrolase/transferase [Pseudomonadota bacterium]